MRTDWGEKIVIPHVVCSDLLPDLLIRLPLKSLTRFRLVCKRWQSVITTDLSHLLIRNQNPTPVGLLIFSVNCAKIDYLPFFSTSAIPTLTTVGFGVEPFNCLQSCNGLLLCSKYFDDSTRYYVCNPTTNKSLRLPGPDNIGDDWTNIRMCLAFDPADSPCYKVVALMCTSNYMFQIYIYSSNTGKWRASGGPFWRQLGGVQGVYWNGAVHWISSNPSISPDYFHVENEMLQTMPSVPMNKSIEGGDWTNRYYYVGETRGHLYYVESGFKGLYIYEMKRDYSEWFLKHTVNLYETTLRGYKYQKVVILSVVCGKDDNVSFLVLRVHGRIIRYNVVSNICEKLHDIEDKTGQTRAFHYIESICPV